MFPLSKFFLFSALTAVLMVDGLAVAAGSGSATGATSGSANVAASASDASGSAVLAPTVSSLLGSREVRSPIRTPGFGLDFGGGLTGLVLQTGRASSIFHQDNVASSQSPRDLRILLSRLEFVRRFRLSGLFSDGHRFRGASGFAILEVASDNWIPFHTEVGLGYGGFSLPTSSAAALLGFGVGLSSSLQLGYELRLPVTRDERPDWLIKNVFYVRFNLERTRGASEVWSCCHEGAADVQ